MTLVIEVRITTARPGRPPLTPAQVARVRAMQDRIDREVTESLAAKRASVAAVSR